MQTNHITVGLGGGIRMMNRSSYFSLEKWLIQYFSCFYGPSRLLLHTYVYYMCISVYRRYNSSVELVRYTRTIKLLQLRLFPKNLHASAHNFHEESEQRT